MFGDKPKNVGVKELFSFVIFFIVAFSMVWIFMLQQHDTRASYTLWHIKTDSDNDDINRPNDGDIRNSRMDSSELFNRQKLENNIVTKISIKDIMNLLPI